MANELYADGIGEITVTGSIVRIDFMSLSATERDDAEQSEAGVPPADHHAGRRLRQRGRPDAEGACRSGRSRRRPRRIGEVADQLPDGRADASAPRKSANASPNFN